MGLGREEEEKEEIIARWNRKRGKATSVGQSQGQRWRGAERQTDI